MDINKVYQQINEKNRKNLCQIGYLDGDDCVSVDFERDDIEGDEDSFATVRFEIFEDNSYSVRVQEYFDNELCENFNGETLEWVIELKNMFGFSPTPTGKPDGVV